MPQGFTHMQSDMIGLVAFDLVLRIILARMMDVAFVVHVARMDPHDTAADPASFGIPTYVIADFEFLCHVFNPHTIGWFLHGTESFISALCVQCCPQSIQQSHSDCHGAARILGPFVAPQPGQAPPNTCGSPKVRLLYIFNGLIKREVSASWLAEASGFTINSAPISPFQNSMSFGSVG
jgi:hypothetical protein